MAEAKPGYIDAILSTHFDECSIAAADAARLAETWFSHDETRFNKSVQPIGSFLSDDLVDFKFSHLGSTIVRHESIAGGKVELAIANQPLRQMPLSLVAIFNSDIMLPLATFERRSDGQCSYVQLGQEIEDDSLVVTTDAPRAAYVEAIRHLISRNPDDEDVQELIKKLIVNEADKYHAQIEHASAPAVTRMAEKYFKSHTIQGSELKDIKVLNDIVDHDAASTRNFAVKDLTFISDDDKDLDALDGRGVRLVLARELDKVTTPGSAAKSRRFWNRSKNEEVADSGPLTKGNLQLLAVVRGGVALKLLEFSSAKGFVTEDGIDQYADQETLACLMQSLTEASEENRRKLTTLKWRVMDAINDKCNLHINNRRQLTTRIDGYYDSSKGVSTITNNSWDKAKKALLKEYRHYRGGEIIELLSGDDEKPLAALCAHLKVSNRLSSLLGPGKSQHEELMSKLGGLITAGEVSYTGTLRGKKAGKTRTDVDTTVTLTSDNKKVRVHVSGRPSALEGFESVTIFDEVLRMDAKNKMEASKLKEIAEVIGAICVTERD